MGHDPDLLTYVREPSLYNVGVVCRILGQYA